jgi:hypothetical protein
VRLHIGAAGRRIALPGWLFEFDPVPRYCACAAVATIANAPARIVFAAPICLVSAQNAKVSIDMVGIGRMSCAHWRSTHEHLLEGTIWIYGFWTGVNYVAAASDQTQAKIDVAAIVAEVEKTCAQQTSQTLASAVWSTYLGSKR